MNIFQKKLLEVYGDGDYRHLLDPEFKKSISFAHMPESFDVIGHWIGSNGGDTLLLFLWRELSSVNTDTAEEAVRLIECARRDIDQVLDAMEALQRDVQLCAEGAPFLDR